MSFSMIRFNRELLKLSKDLPKLKKCRFLCSEIQAGTTDIPAFYRTSEHNPVNHDPKHIGRLYTVSKINIFF